MYRKALAITGTNVVPQELWSNLTNQIEQAKFLGLRGQLKRLKLNLAAAVLESKNMSLLRLPDTSFLERLRGKARGKDVLKRNADGSSKWLNHRADITPLRDYTGNIPPEILNKVPSGIPLSNRTVVLDLDKDPIIAIRIGYTNYYVGILVWE